MYKISDLKHDECRICQSIACPADYGLDNELWENAIFRLCYATREVHGHEEFVGHFYRHDFQMRISELHFLIYQLRTTHNLKDHLLIPDPVDGHFFFHIMHPNSPDIDKFGGVKTIEQDAEIYKPKSEW